VNHTPWRPERVASLALMLPQLGDAMSPNTYDMRGRPFYHAKVDWIRVQWEWALKTDATHHLFMSDDLHLAPSFVRIVEAMVVAVPDKPIGLLSNHPRAPAVAAAGQRWYRTNSWLVGPAYVLPRACLEGVYKWHSSLPRTAPEDSATVGQSSPEWADYWNDDSAVNEWVTRQGPGETWHPVPAPIEHRGDLESTIGHGDKYSRERYSWRQMQHPVVGADGVIHWETHAHAVVYSTDEMARPSYWAADVTCAPMLPTGE